MIRDYLQQIVFDWPWALGLLILVPIWVFFALKRQKKNTVHLQYASTKNIVRPKTLRLRLQPLPIVIRGLAIASLIVALAKPAHYQTLEMTEGEGIDIVLCMDVSGSMLARDFTPDRLQAALQVARNFVQRRKGDRIGLVIFSGQSLALCPLTSDEDAVLAQLNSIEYGHLSDGTAIGTGLASAVDRLRGVTTPGKVVVLMTDGEDTGGFFDPETAKQLAVTYGIKVYTIGVGSIGMAPMPYQTPGGTVLQQEKVSIDEGLLKNIASSTGGKYFRATNTQVLDSVYSEIDQIEKSKVETRIFTKRTDEFFPWVMAAIALLLLELLLSSTFFRKLP
ncbi:MAG TPA: VWA domain-containing protein [Phnomibacter sp.]|nr:VWA domain-containing protein [Phnomibacter sp.]